MHASAAVIQQAWRGVLGGEQRMFGSMQRMPKCSRHWPLCSVQSGSLWEALSEENEAAEVAERRIAASIRMQKFGRSILGKKRFADEQGRQDEDVWTQVRRGNVAAVEDLRALGFILDADATEILRAIPS